MKKMITLVALAVALATAATAQAGGRGDAVYTLTNATSGNGVAVFERAANGALGYAATYATGGLGTGVGLGSQGAVTISANGQLLFAVNAGSNSVSEFAIRGNGLALFATFDSNGVRPISVTSHKNLLYVLNAGSSSITGFKIDGEGRVEALAGSTRPLLGANPAEVQFSPDGSALVVTEKATSTIDVFRVDDRGRAQAAVSTPSAGAVPFGFAFDALGRLYVSEASGSASSYTIDAAGPQVISGAVATGQGAPCWLVLTPDGRFAYTANAGGGSVSGFAVGVDGSIALASTTPLGAGSHPLDEAVSSDGRFLYVLVDGRHTVASYAIGENGSLTLVGETGVLPAGAIGLAAS